MKSFSLIISLVFLSSGYSFSSSLNWVKSFGGSGHVVMTRVIEDVNGNVFVGGSFKGTVDFNPGSGITSKSSVGGTYDIFFAKFNSAGDLFWVNAIGGSYEDDLKDLEVSALGFVYIAGNFRGSNIDFNPGSGIQNLTSNNNSQDFYLAQYTTNGALSWAQRFGGGDDDQLNAMALNASGSAYITGKCKGTVNMGGGNVSGSGIFVAGYDAAGNNFLRFNVGDSRAGNVGKSLKISADGTLLLAGTFVGYNVDFDPTPAVKADTAYNDGATKSVFVARYNSSSGQCQYVSRMLVGDVSCIHSDGGNNIYIAAFMGYDKILARILTNGIVDWYRKIPGYQTYPGSERCISIDPSGNIYFVGRIEGKFDLKPGADSTYISAYPIGSRNIYVAKYTGDADLMWAFTIGSTQIVDQVQSNTIFSNTAGHFFIGGEMSTSGQVDFDPGINNTGTPGGFHFAKYNQCIPAQAPVVEGNTLICNGSNTKLLVNSQLFESTTWKWYQGNCGNGSPIGTGPSLTINPTLPTTYSVRAEGGFCPDLTQCTIVQVNVQAQVTPKIFITSDARNDSICPNDLVTFSAYAQGTGNSPAYQWYNNNVPVGQGLTYYTSSSINHRDQVTCDMTSNAVCASSNIAGSNKIMIYHKPIPSRPIVTRNGNVLTSSALSGNQWYNNSGAIAGETNPTLDITNYINSPWEYFYTIVSDNGCESEQSLAVEVTDIQDAFSSSVKIYLFPNPVKDFLFIRLGGRSKASVRIYSCTGELAMNESSINDNEMLDVINLPSGLYVARIDMENKISFLKFVKQ